MEVGGAGAGERLPCNPVLMCRRDARPAAAPLLVRPRTRGPFLDGDELVSMYREVIYYLLFHLIIIYYYVQCILMHTYTCQWMQMNVLVHKDR